MPDTAPETATAAPLPKFHHHAYGVDLDYIGEDGEIVAHGHVPLMRFVAAANHMARRVAGLSNLWDDRTLRLADTASSVFYRWAVNRDGHDEYEWFIDCGDDITAETPGAFPITYLSD